jgi:hypothetical protein
VDEDPDPRDGCDADRPSHGGITPLG